MHRLLFICFPVVLRHAGLSARQNIKRVSRLSYVVADLVGVRLVQDKAEAKVAALEARSEEQRKERAQAEAEWRRQQRDRELKRAQEEIEREKEARPCCFAQHPLLHVLCLVPCVKCCAACKSACPPLSCISGDFPEAAFWDLSALLGGQSGC